MFRIFRIEQNSFSWAPPLASLTNFPEAPLLFMETLDLFMDFLLMELYLFFEDLPLFIVFLSFNFLSPPVDLALLDLVLSISEFKFYLLLKNVFVDWGACIEIPVFIPRIIFLRILNLQHIFSFLWSYFLAVESPKFYQNLDKSQILLANWQ